MKEVTKSPEIPYQNNPFMLALDGLKLIFNNAQSVAILLVVLCALGAVSYVIPDPSTNTSVSQNSQMPSFDPAIVVVAGVIIATILFAVIIFMTILYAVFGHTAAKLARNEATTLEASIKDGFQNFWPFVWLLVILQIKILLWTLLFIIPGIYKSVQYSLAIPTFFAEGKRGNEAIKRSIELTNGAWLTTFASHSLFNLITLYFIQPLLTPGTDALLYRQLKAYTDAKVEKPKAHVLSWITLAIVITVVVLMIVFTILAIAAFAYFMQNPLGP